ncbi:hypothetical protein [Halomonas organivorans]|uniref:Uncharacterized protein n=1 Tax=Halomonas organivorans TaxID=257772 RepID=A0A7W5BYE2_9GAMM|nr:hypothetical protein [Halomonas organivorans]MBB3141404.1 hypothetical protein [Halomonas organivorans]
MRHFLFPRQPLPRSTLLFCHATIQLGLLAAGGLWLAPRTPWLADTDWATAWPELALGGGVMLLAMVATRLLAELWLLPHYLAAQRPGFAPGAVVTRSVERRPAVHDQERAWTAGGREVDGEDAVLSPARVARQAPRRRQDEPSLDLAGGHAEPAPANEPRL